MSSTEIEALSAMTADRALFFMERFLKEEKLLGPNEQAALRFVIDMLEPKRNEVAAPAGGALSAADLGHLEALVNETRISPAESCAVYRALQAFRTHAKSDALDAAPVRANQLHLSESMKAALTANSDGIPEANDK